MGTMHLFDASFVGVSYLLLVRTLEKTAGEEEGASCCWPICVLLFDIWFLVLDLSIDSVVVYNLCIPLNISD